MLEKIRFRNFRSFAEETLIDFTPSRIEYLSNENVYDGALKGIAFYGSNASGKTNALLAITLLLDLLFKNGISLETSFTLFNNEPKMWFEYSFRFDGEGLIYAIELDKKKGITKETLEQDGKLLLNRTLTSAKSYITENQDYDDIDPNSLFIRSIYFNTRFAGRPLLSKWINYLKGSIYWNPVLFATPIIIFDPRNASDTMLESYLESHGTNSINAFLKEYSFPFTIEYESKNNNPIASVTNFSMRLKISRKGMPTIPFFMESFGSKVLLTFLPSYLTVIEKGGILAIDEFSSGLHNDLEELLVQHFYRHSKRAQLVFVSHSTNLLKTSLLRPDQVYSVEFDEKGSYLCKFSEHGIRESQNMEKMYLAGAFGGIPLYGADPKSK